MIKCMATLIMNFYDNLNEIIVSDGNLKYYRIPGVLQRFGVCYFFVAMMQLLLPPMEKGEKKVALKVFALRIS